MWRSVFAARALLNRQVVRKFHAIKNPEPKIAFRSFNCEYSRFFSQHSPNESGFESQLSESVDFGNNDDAPLKVLDGELEVEMDDIEKMSSSSVEGLHEESLNDFNAHIDGGFEKFSSGHLQIDDIGSARFSSENEIGETFEDNSHPPTDGTGVFPGTVEEEDEAYEINVEQHIDGGFEKFSSSHLQIDDIGSARFSSENEIGETFRDNSHAPTDGTGVFPGTVAEEDEAYEINVEQLESVLSLLQSRVDGSFESSLDKMDLILHVDFVVKVLGTPLISGENLIRFFEWAMKKPEFKLDTRALDALVCAICSDLRRKDAYSLWDLIKDIGEKKIALVNTQILNELIALFSRLGKGKAAMEVFNKLEEFECVPNPDTYYFTVEALCRRSLCDWASSICEKMLGNESLPDSEKVGKLLRWLCKGKRVREAHSVYVMAKEKKRFPPKSSVYFLVSSLSREDETVNLALKILDDFSGMERKYAIKPFSSVLRGLCRIKKNEEAKGLLSKMVSDGPPPGNAAFNTVINGYSKTGDLDVAIKLMRLMEDRGLKPDVFTYTVLISGYAKGGQMEEACEVLSEAKKKHSKLTPVTYHTLIRAYCKLEEFDKALKLLSEMKDFGVEPNHDEYNKLIQSLCLKAVDWEKAEKLLEEMKEKGLHLNGITRGLIQAVKELEEEASTAEMSVTA